MRLPRILEHASQRLLRQLRWEHVLRARCAGRLGALVGGLGRLRDRRREPDRRDGLRRQPRQTETFAFNAANGEKVWTFKDGAYNPVISDGVRLYLTGYKTLYALKPRTPAEVRRKAKAAEAKKTAAGKKAGKKQG